MCLPCLDTLKIKKEVYGWGWKQWLLISTQPVALVQSWIIYFTWLFWFLSQSIKKWAYRSRETTLELVFFLSETWEIFCTCWLFWKINYKVNFHLFWKTQTKASEEYIYFLFYFLTRKVLLFVFFYFRSEAYRTHVNSLVYISKLSFTNAAPQFNSLPLNFIISGYKNIMHLKYQISDEGQRDNPQDMKLNVSHSNVSHMNS